MRTLSERETQLFQRGAVAPGHACDGDWAEKSARLKLSFGGVLLYAARFRALMFQKPFTSLSADPDRICPPLDSCPPQVRAAIIRSHPLQTPLPRVSLAPGHIRYVPSQYRRFYVEIEGTFPDYMKKFTAKRRHNLTRSVRKFAELSGGGLRWREYQSPEEMEEFHRLAREVSRKTYQEKLVDAGLDDSEEFRTQLAELAARNQLRGYLLFAGETPVAYQLCPVEGNILGYEKIGYDPAYRQHSPGTVLLYLTIEKLFADGNFRRLDFGRGEYPYKESFSTGSVQCGDIYYFRRTLRNLLLVGAHSLLDLSSKGLADLLDRVRLKHRIKQLLHYGLARTPK